MEVRHAVVFRLLSIFGLLFLAKIVLDAYKKRVQYHDEFLFWNCKIPAQQRNKLTLRQIDILIRQETVCVFCPVSVQRTRVVESLSAYDERCKEYAMARCTHTNSIARQNTPQSVQVNQSGHECGRLNVGVFDQATDELSQRHKFGRVLLWGILDLNNRIGRGDQDIDHLVGDVLSGKDFQGFSVRHCKRSIMKLR